MSPNSPWLKYNGVKFYHKTQQNHPGQLHHKTLWCRENRIDRALCPQTTRHRSCSVHALPHTYRNDNTLRAPRPTQTGRGARDLVWATAGPGPAASSVRHTPSSGLAHSTPATPWSVSGRWPCGQPGTPVWTHHPAHSIARTIRNWPNLGWWKLINGQGKGGCLKSFFVKLSILTFSNF